MNTKIIAFAGAKQAGKSTCSNFLHGYQLRANEVVEDMGITDQGKLFVKTDVKQSDDSVEAQTTYLDVTRRDQEFVEWAAYNMWPYVKKYSFADTLKELSIRLFGLTHEQCYGTEAYKNQQVPHLRWENMPGIYTGRDQGLHDYVTYHEPGPMTVRDFLQYFGTEICRNIYQNCHVNSCLNDIKYEEPLLAIIDDCRFENEIKAVQEAGGKVIGLTRQPFEDSHSSEQVVKENSHLFDAVIDNQDMDIHTMCTSVIEQIAGWGWFNEVRVNNKRETIHTIKGDK
jgi:hypothetical protein